MSEKRYIPPKNPVIKTIFTADPEAKVWDSEPDKLYLYPSRDRYPSAGCDHMDQYHVFSTVNMVDFVDEGEILRRSDLNWTEVTDTHPETGSELTFMWAPDAAYKNGYYYYYWPTPKYARHRPKDAPEDYMSWNNTWETGVVRSRKPNKDFEPIPEKDAYPGFKGYIEGIGYAGIDASVRVYENKAYIYLGGGGNYYQGRLKDNMVEMDGPLTKLTENKNGRPAGGISHALPDYHEGPSMFRRKNDSGEMVYYLIYPGYEHPPREGMLYGDSFRYAMGKTPLGNPLKAPVTEDTDRGPQTREYSWDYKGIFFDPTGCDTSHGSVVEFKNKYYFVYHTQDLSGHGTNRSMCIDEFGFNPDGTIIPFAKTLDGVKKNGPDYTRPKGIIYNVNSAEVYGEAELTPGENGENGKVASGLNAPGSGIVFSNVYGGISGGRAMIVFGYSTPDELPKMELLVNGVSYSYINFIKTGGAKFFAEAEFTPRALQPDNTNKIELRSGASDNKGEIFLSHIEVILFDE
ncbi:MAG: family 43 glycosylhydrolase [Oscillospiraceae bacterium]|nr:family 43 glycosylhydrolase [Oscillospiraceae bacterium]